MYESKLILTEGLWDKNQNPLTEERQVKGLKAENKLQAGGRLFGR